MKKHIIFRLAYSLVCSAFVFCLLGVVFIILQTFFFGRNSNSGTITVEHGQGCGLATEARIVKDIRFSKSSPANDTSSKLHTINGWSYGYDTLAVLQDGDAYINQTSTINIYALKKNKPVYFYLFKLHQLLIYSCYALLLYQLFLILYDVRNDRVFMPENKKRTMIIGYCLFALALLNIIAPDFWGYIDNEQNLVISGISYTMFPKDFLLYLFMGSITIVFAWVFGYGTTIREENDLTV
jgi:hypothetical protein